MRKILYEVFKMERFDIRTPKYRKALYDLNQLIKGFSKTFWSIGVGDGESQIIVPDASTSTVLDRSFAVAHFDTESLHNSFIDTSQMNEALKQLCVETSMEEKKTVVLTNIDKGIDVPVGIQFKELKSDIETRMKEIQSIAHRPFTTYMTLTDDIKEMILDYQVVEVRFPHTDETRPPINLILSKELLPAIKKAELITLQARWNTVEDLGSPEMATVLITSSTLCWEFYTVVHVLPY